MHKNKLLITKALVIFSILASFTSFYTIEKGWGAIYPFSTYKLYSQPLGSNHTFTHYRIYSRSSSKENYKRNNISETPNFSNDDYSYLLDLLTQKTLFDTLNQSDYKIKLLTFVKHVVPGQVEYKIVAETFHPMEILKTGRYDTTTVVTF